MKKIIYTILLIAITSQLTKSQISLTYENHALKAGENHTTQYVENVNHGDAGENQIWDFTDFKCDKTKTSEINSAFETENYSKFSESNIAVFDDENEFYFNVNEDVNEYLGLTTTTAVIHFNQPIIKMKYPFDYKDEISGEFSGEGLYYGEIISDIYGDYYVTADGYGTILLPNNVSIDNVLRIKTINHIFETACNTTEFINEKYLWYSENSRYPIMVVINNTKITNNDTIITNFGYYNENAYQTQLEVAHSNIIEYSVNVYPNPFVDNINISYSLKEEAKVNIEIFNSIGQKIETLVDNQLQNGNQIINYNVNKNSLAVGNYYIKILINENVITKKIIMVD